MCVCVCGGGGECVGVGCAGVCVWGGGVSVCVWCVCETLFEPFCY